MLFLSSPDLVELGAQNSGKRAEAEADLQYGSQKLSQQNGNVSVKCSSRYRNKLNELKVAQEQKDCDRDL